MKHHKVAYSRMGLDLRDNTLKIGVMYTVHLYIQFPLILKPIQSLKIRIYSYSSFLHNAHIELCFKYFYTYLPSINCGYPMSDSFSPLPGARAHGIEWHNTHKKNNEP